MERLERFEPLERSKSLKPVSEASDSAIYGTPGGLVLPS